MAAAANAAAEETPRHMRTPILAIPLYATQRMAAQRLATDTPLLATPTHDQPRLATDHHPQPPPHRGNHESPRLTTTRELARKNPMATHAHTQRITRV